jgi:hypothetical protein
VYSALAKFGTPGANPILNRPTATDEGGVNRGKTDITTASMLCQITGCAMCHIAVQDTPSGNIYPFWLYLAGRPTTNTTIIALDSLVQYSSLDTDPCFPIAALDPVITNLTAGITDVGYGWMRYGMVDAEWAPMAAFAYYSSLAQYIPSTYTSGGPSPDPYIAKWPILRVPIGRISAQGNVPGTKGVLATQAFLLPGWPSATIKPVV